MDFLDRLALAEAEAYVERIIKKYGKAKGPGEGIRYRTQKRDAMGHWVDDVGVPAAKKPRATNKPKPATKPADSTKPKVSKPKPAYQFSPEIQAILDGAVDKPVDKPVGKPVAKKPMAKKPATKKPVAPKKTPEVKPASSPKKPAKQSGFLTDEDAIQSLLPPPNPFAEMDAEELEALDRYTLGGHKNTNAYLRNTRKKLDLRARAVIEGLDMAMEKAAVPADVTVYRGVNSTDILKGNPGDFDSLEEYLDSMVGAQFRDPGFVSTSVDPGVADAFSSDTVMEIRVPKGTKGFYMEPITNVPGEEELLLDRGYEFKITGIEDNGEGNYRVVVEPVEKSQQKFELPATTERYKVTKVRVPKAEYGTAAYPADAWVMKDWDDESVLIEKREVVPVDQ